MRKFPTILVLLSLLMPGCDDNESKLTSTTQSDVFFGQAITQVSISKINGMPDMPDNYLMLDWEAKAQSYDDYVFDWNRSTTPGPMIWMDFTYNNIDQMTFGLYTSVLDARQGMANASSHEAINTIAAVLSGGLVGVDKTDQDGYNYPKMLQNYFAVDNGWNIMLNNTYGYSTDWWYNVLPNVLYWGVCDVFPDVDGADDIQRTIADQFAAADEVMGSSYDYVYFNFGSMTGVTGSLKQQDAAGGHAYILLNAYRKFGDESYLEHAINAIDVLHSQTESRFYEILMPFGIYTAAVLNAEQGCDYDIEKMLKWVFNGSASRSGWGVIVGTWGDYPVDGLQGSITDGGGYAFLMNCFEMAWPLVPMVKYQPEWAAAIGKWLLNCANASRFFYPGNIDDEHQYAADYKELTENNVAYEGLRYSDRYGIYNVCPIAEGDGPTWDSDNGITTMFSLYSTSPVGIFGSIIRTTDVEGVLRLDCNATDFYASRAYPTYLYYNPYAAKTLVTYETSSDEKCDLFDIVAKSYVAKSVSGSTTITLPASGACVIVELPAGTSLNYVDGTIVADGSEVIAYK